MAIRRHPGIHLAAVGVLLALWCAGGIANAVGPFVLTSTTFKDGGTMPQRVSNKPPPNPNCVGKNVSPQLSWKNPPAETKSYAFTLARTSC